MSKFLDNLLDRNQELQADPRYNDAAIDETWAILPSTYLGARAIKGGVTATRNGLNWFNGIRPYLGDIWAGRNLIFHKPFGLMSKAERGQFGKLGESYYKDVLHNQTANNSLVNNNAPISFPNSRKGKVFYEMMEQLPFARYNIGKSKSNQRMFLNKQREDATKFDNLRVNWKGKNYAYQLRDNKNTNTMEFHNIKPWKLLQDEVEQRKLNGDLFYDLLTK